MLPDPQDVIVALSSAPGPGARAIVRLSGPNALHVINRVFTQHSALSTQHSALSTQHSLREGEIKLPGVHSPLPADLYYWPGPHSYTGQDLAELHTLSSPALVDLLIAELLNAGARSAQPGEFTMRAFLAGKLDLTRAEAVLGVIEAGSRQELKQALAQLAGGVGRPLQELRDDLLNLLADVEAGLDFAEEDIHFVGSEDLLKRLAKGLALVTLAAKQLVQRSLADRPFRAVLVGRPNAGKSSLFNALAGASALISPQPGTTRDYLIKRLDFDGVSVELVDTAGRWEGQTTIERQAQTFGREQIEQADLLLLCVEADGALDEEQTTLLGQHEPPVVLVATKCDLAQWPHNSLATSTVTGRGLDDLRRILAERAKRRPRPALAPSLSRCRHHVDACLDHLRRAHKTVLFEEPPEVLALEVRGALDELGAMVGAVYTDDLLDRIFSRFCIGK